MGRPRPTFASHGSHIRHCHASCLRSLDVCHRWEAVALYPHTKERATVGRRKGVNALARDGDPF